MGKESLVRKLKRRVKFLSSYALEKTKGLDFSMMKLTKEHYTPDHPTEYYGYFMTDEKTIRGALNLLPINPAEKAFVDIGCGKGMCLKHACAAGFKKVSGIEFVPEIAAVARKNMRILKLPAEVIECDATKFEHYADYDVFYFYNPFARPIFTQVVDAINRSLEERPRTIHVLYLVPHCDDLFIDSGFKKINEFFDEARGSQLFVYEKTTEM